MRSITRILGLLSCTIAAWVGTAQPLDPELQPQLTTDMIDGGLFNEGGSFLTDNARWSIHTAARGIHSERAGSFSYLSWVGLDYHKVVSTDQGDVATINPQL